MYKHSKSIVPLAELKALYIVKLTLENPIQSCEWSTLTRLSREGACLVTHYFQEPMPYIL